MQDHFLFDSDDPKQRGKGCDRLGSKKDGLALRWYWGRVCDRSWSRGDKNLEDKRRTPGQCCYAELGKGWSLVVTYWHSNYEAATRYNGDDVRNFNKDRGDKYPGAMLVTRLQAQLKAEQLTVDVWKELRDLLEKKEVFKTKIVERMLGRTT